MTDLPEPTSVPAPDAKRLFLLLRGLGLDDEQAYTFVQEVDNMAAANLIARFESKLDAQNTRLDAQNAKLDAHNTKLDAISSAVDSRLRMLMWLIGAAVAAIGIFVRLSS